MAGGGGGGEGEPEFQVAPMIDVLLVLLIFFMSITSSQVLKVDKNISLPVASNGVKRDDKAAAGLMSKHDDLAAVRLDVTDNLVGVGLRGVIVLRQLFQAFLQRVPVAAEPAREFQRRRKRVQQSALGLHAAPRAARTGIA